MTHPKIDRASAMAGVTDSVRAATRDVDGGQYNTTSLRRAAESVVDLRTTFIGRDGEPDMAGASYAYRQAIREALGDAGVPESERPKVLTAMRYHIGNVLRERYSAAELASWGLKSVSPLERQRADRQVRAKAWHAAVSPSDEPIEDPALVLGAIRSASALLSNVRVGQLRGGDRKKADVMLDEVTSIVAKLRSSRGRRTVPAT